MSERLTDEELRQQKFNHERLLDRLYHDAEAFDFATYKALTEYSDTLFVMLRDARAELRERRQQDAAKDARILPDDQTWEPDAHGRMVPAGSEVVTLSDGYTLRIARGPGGWVLFGDDA